MADRKMTGLGEITSLTSDDLLLVVNDPSGTPTSKKITVGNFQSGIFSSKTDGADVVITQYDDTEVGRIHDGAVLPTLTGSGSPTVTGGTGFGFRRRILTLGSG
ncbi:uncharacterized protein METZ01_LOCUS404166, partial [marine metagenome]